ncbi:hypothetical protein VP01_1329g5 [Puccinia sorghi]|uniref:Uncharacterized protein n=1 Tax=Puccinia sorghi TaxID=27349 RepID=A0A0L6VMI5_9BASI|nr:hypothetical protein VP01_1329g5 [Puccinia sorghi]
MCLNPIRLTAKKNFLNCLQLTCRKSQEASVVTPNFLHELHSHCVDGTVTVPKQLHMQKGLVWMEAWLEHAACQFQAGELTQSAPCSCFFLRGLCQYMHTSIYAKLAQKCEKLGINGFCCSSGILCKLLQLTNFPEKYSTRKYLSQKDKQKRIDLFQSLNLQVSWVIGKLNDWRTSNVCWNLLDTNLFRITSEKFPIIHEDLSCFGYKTLNSEIQIFELNESGIKTPILPHDIVLKPGYEGWYSDRPWYISTVIYMCRLWWTSIGIFEEMLNQQAFSLVIPKCSSAKTKQKFLLEQMQTPQQRYKNPTLKDINRKKCYTLNMEAVQVPKMLAPHLRSCFMVIIKVFSHILYSRTRNLNFLRLNVINGPN